MFFYAALVCLFVGSIAIFAVIADDMGKELGQARYEEWAKRQEYQRRMRHIICMMIDHNDADILEDLEWNLHSTIYEYRHGY